MWLAWRRAGQVTVGDGGLGPHTLGSYQRASSEQVMCLLTFFKLFLAALRLVEEAWSPG